MDSDGGFGSASASKSCNALDGGGIAIDPAAVSSLASSCVVDVDSRKSLLVFSYAVACLPGANSMSRKH